MQLRKFLSDFYSIVSPVDNTRSITDEDFYTAAASLAKQVSAERLAMGCAYPPLNDIREVSLRIAVDVANEIFDSGRATVPRPDNLAEFTRNAMYVPIY